MEYFWNTLKKLKNGGSKTADASDSFLVINDVIVVIHMLANFLIL